MVGPKAKRPGKGENEKKNIEGKVQKKLDNQKATGFTYVDTSVTPTTTIFQAVMEQAVWQRYEGHNNPFFQEIRLRRRDGAWIQSSDFMNFWTKRKCYRGAVFFFYQKMFLKFYFAEPMKRSTHRACFFTIGFHLSTAPCGGVKE